ncbi:MAG: AI-2E family transporter [Lachnospiraceae bacterium]|nr:AI-2E family transporter [Lachnospiraceae bacterium]
MKRLIEKLDQKYLKICLYAGITVVLVVCAIFVLLSTGPFWSKFWTILTAVLKPIVIGGILCYLFYPIVGWFEGVFSKNGKKKWARTLSVFLTLFIVIAVIALIICLIVVTVYKNVESLSMTTIQSTIYGLQQQYADIWQFVLDELENSGITNENFPNIIATVTEVVKDFFSSLFFGIIFSIYFLLDGKRISTYWNRVILVLFGKKSEDDIKQFLSDADSAFSGYIRGQFLDALLIGVISMFVLSLAGIPNAVLVGLFVGIGNMIPYVGPVVGYITVVIVCLPSAAIDKMLIGIIILTILMFVDGNIINPKLLSNTVSVHPLLVVAALIAGGAIGGIAGMLVAVPTAALIKMQFDRYLDKIEEMNKESEKETTSEKRVDNLN